MDFTENEQEIASRNCVDRVATQDSSRPIGQSPRPRYNHLRDLISCFTVYA